MLFKNYLSDDNSLLAAMGKQAILMRLYCSDSISCLNNDLLSVIPLAMRKDLLQAEEVFLQVDGCLEC